MDVFALIAAFGGGVFAAAIGALPAFIMTGVMVIAGNMAAAELSGTIVGGVAFGSMFGPHVSFAAGVAAAAFAAHNRKCLGSGADIVTSLNKFNDMSVIVVGGVFGVIGYLLNFAFAQVLKLPTDTIALTVVTSAIIARLVFGKSGLFGKTPENEKRVWYPMGGQLIYNVIFGFSAALVFAYIANLTKLATLGFGISAVSLVFAQMGFAIPATHHISLIAGIATLASGNIFVGAVFGLVSNLVFELGARVLNSYHDTHIDPPAFAIFIMTTVVLLVL